MDSASSHPLGLTLSENSESRLLLQGLALWSASHWFSSELSPSETRSTCGFCLSDSVWQHFIGCGSVWDEYTPPLCVSLSPSLCLTAYANIPAGCTMEAGNTAELQAPSLLSAPSFNLNFFSSIKFTVSIITLYFFFFLVMNICPIRNIYKFFLLRNIFHDDTQVSHPYVSKRCGLVMLFRKRKQNPVLMDHKSELNTCFCPTHPCLNM